MSTVKFIYKCRRCGELYSDSGCGLSLAKQIIINIAFDIDTPGQPMAPEKFSVHFCKDGEGQGLSDFIGFEKE